MSLAKLKSISLESFDVLSIDIFDTLLLRDASVQRQRFQEVAAVVAQSLQARGHAVAAGPVLALRRRVHRLAYDAVALERPGGDATLTRMSEIQAELLELDATVTPVFIAAEFEVESRHLSANAALIDWIGHLRAAGKKVVAISDIYLSRAQVSELITRVVGSVPVDTVYTSSDLGSTKDAGGMFAAVAAHEGTPTSRFLHCGDNAHADVAMARRAGCQAELLARPSWMHSARRAAAVQALLTVGF